MDDFKKLTEQLLKIYINAESVNDFGIENYFDENISLIGTGKHELFTNLHEFLESFKFDVKRRGKISIEERNLHQEEERLDDDHVLAYGTVDFAGLFKDGSSCFEMETRFTIIYQMPVMNGYDATLAIRKMKDTKKAGIPIIAMTANVFAEDIQKVLSVGMNAHVTKPVDMNILVPTMMKYL